MSPAGSHRQNDEPSSRVTVPPPTRAGSPANVQPSVISHPPVAEMGGDGAADWPAHWLVLATPSPAAWALRWWASRSVKPTSAGPRLVPMGHSGCRCWRMDAMWQGRPAGRLLGRPCVTCRGPHQRRNGPAAVPGRDRTHHEREHQDSTDREASPPGLRPLANAAPVTVPVTPGNGAAMPADTAARVLAASWVGLSSGGAWLADQARGQHFRNSFQRLTSRGGVCSAAAHFWVIWILRGFLSSLFGIWTVSTP